MLVNMYYDSDNLTEKRETLPFAEVVLDSLWNSSVDTWRTITTTCGSVRLAEAYSIPTRYFSDHEAEQKITVLPTVQP